MGLYAVDGGVVVAVACAVLGVVGEGSGGFAGGEKSCYDEEEERREGDGEGNCNRMIANKRIEITQFRYKRVRFHFVRWLGVGLDG